MWYTGASAVASVGAAAAAAAVAGATAGATGRALAGSVGRAPLASPASLVRRASSRPRRRSADAKGDTRRAIAGCRCRQVRTDAPRNSAAPAASAGDSTASDSAARPSGTSPRLGVDSQGLGPRRFYRQARYIDVGDGRFAVQVDGRTVATPAGGRLVVPSEQLAFGVAYEWERQTRRLRPTSMPLTSLASATVDLMPEHRNETVDAVVNFAVTDTVSFRSAEPESLRAVQELTWDPLLEHVRDKYGASLGVTYGLAGVQPSPAEGIARVRTHVSALDDWTLTALHSAAATSKSCVIALALCDGALDADRALRAAFCEEEWQERVWGRVEGNHDVDRADALVRLGAVSVVSRIIRQQPQLFAAPAPAAR